MKEKTKLLGYLLLGVVLTYTVLMVGCGKNPFTTVLSGVGGVLGSSGNVKVSVGKL